MEDENDPSSSPETPAEYMTDAEMAPPSLAPAAAEAHISRAVEEMRNKSDQLMAEGQNKMARLMDGLTGEKGLGDPVYTESPDHRALLGEVCLLYTSDAADE